MQVLSCLHSRGPLEAGLLPSVLESELKHFARVVLLRTRHIHSWISNLARAHPKSGKCSSIHTANKQISEARFGAPSSALLAWLWWFPDERTNIPCELHVVAVLTRHVRHGHCASPSGTGRSGPPKHGNHHRWHTELLRECTQVWSNGSNEQRTSQTEAISLGALHGEPWETWIPPKKSSGIDFRKHFSFLTRIHDTAWNTFVADVQVLRSRLGCRDLGNNWTTCHLKLKQRHLCNLQILRDFQDKQNHHCHRWLAVLTWNKHHGEMKCQVNNQKSRTTLAVLQLDRHLGVEIDWGSGPIVFRISARMTTPFKESPLWRFCKITHQTPSSARLAWSIPKVDFWTHVRY